MQAVGEYIALEDKERLQKWAENLVKHYLKIGEMVPDWKDELETSVTNQVLMAANNGDFETTSKAIR